VTGNSETAGRLEGKVALITGGAQGQGEAEGRLFAAQGASVWLTDVLSAQGEKVAQEIGGRFISHDVTDQQGWSDVVETVLDADGRIDVLVNNAGVFRLASMGDTDIALWDQMIGVNQTGVYLGMKSVADIMKEQNGGSIINVSSIAGLRGSPTAFAYSASKWAVRGMTKAAALELAGYGIRVNSIHPGIIETAMFDEFVNAGVKDLVTERIPNGRVGTATDVAQLALFLASDESQYSTGSEFVVDGGFTA